MSVTRSGVSFKEDSTIMAQQEPQRELTSLEQMLQAILEDRQAQEQQLAEESVKRG